MATRFIQKFDSLNDIQNLQVAAGIGFVNGQLYVNGNGGPIPVGGVLSLGSVRVVDPATAASNNDIAETIQDAVDGADEGDVILLAPGGYDETVTVATPGLVFVGLGGRGQTFIEPSTAGAEGMQIAGVDDVTLVNLGVAGEGTADYALNLNDVSRFRGYGCKFEGIDAGPAVLLDGTATGQVGDALFRDCEFCWSDVGILGNDSVYGFPTQVFLDVCRFHNITTAHISDGDASIVNLQVSDCIHDNAEDGTAPTTYVSVDGAASTGIFSGNRYAFATNSNTKFVIAAGILWVANATEAGWTAARPS